MDSNLLTSHTGRSSKTVLLDRRRLGLSCFKQPRSGSKRVTSRSLASTCESALCLALTVRFALGTGRVTVPFAGRLPASSSFERSIP